MSSWKGEHGSRTLREAATFDQRAHAFNSARTSANPNSIPLKALSE